jgi:ribonucleoside-diphosphate reductase alpha chain
MSGEFLQVNTALVTELKARGLWTPQVREAIKRADGSVQQVGALPDEIRHLFRTAWELPQRALIDLAAARGPFIDQSQSLNLFMAAPTIGRLSSMYMHAWKSGLKTTYYLRSRPATRIQQATVTQATVTQTTGSGAPAADEAAVACSLENPESCEACQ